MVAVTADEAAGRITEEVHPQARRSATEALSGDLNQFGDGGPLVEVDALVEPVMSMAPR